MGTLDRFLCKQYIHGLPLINGQCKGINFNIRSFEMKDAKNILHLMTHSHDSAYTHFKNIEFMHHDDQFALILEVISSNHAQDEMQEHESNMIGCIKYEWMKFNFWDWRESDWEDYDIDNVYNNMNNSNSKYEKKKLAKESGVRSDYFVRILDLCILNNCTQRGLGLQLLQSLIYAFPSGTRFGVEVPAINTVAVKCFTKCGFTIARVEQGGDTKYKMTAESHYTYDAYLSFVRNSCVTSLKIQNIATNNISQQQKEAKHKRTAVVDDSDDQRLDKLLSDSPQRVSAINRGSIKQIKGGYGGDTDDIEATEEYDDDSEDDPIPEMQQSGSDILGNMMFQYPAIPNSSTFVFDVLRSLNLSQHHHVFMEFNINQEALLHLDPSVVEFMINNETDRKKFLQWLSAYKLQQTESNKQKPSKAPQQPPSTDHDTTEIDDAHRIR